MSRDGWVALPHGAMGLSAVCDCGISRSYPLTIFVKVNTCSNASLRSPQTGTGDRFREGHMIF